MLNNAKVEVEVFNKIHSEAVANINEFGFVSYENLDKILEKYERDRLYFLTMLKCMQDARIY